MQAMWNLPPLPPLVDFCLLSFLSTDGRLFHTVTLVQAGWAVVVGGRKSPLNPALEVLSLRSPEADDSSASDCPVVELRSLQPVGSLALPRWRHSATEVTHQGRSHAFAPWNGPQAMLAAVFVKPSKPPRIIKVKISGRQLTSAI